MQRQRDAFTENQFIQIKILDGNFWQTKITAVAIYLACFAYRITVCGPSYTRHILKTKIGLP